MNINNRTGVAYDTARLIRVLTIFEPIEIVEDEYLPYNPIEDPDLNDPDLNNFYPLLSKLTKYMTRTFLVREAASKTKGNKSDTQKKSPEENRQEKL